MQFLQETTYMILYASRDIGIVMGLLQSCSLLLLLPFSLCRKSLYVHSGARIEEN